jgi:hypothetical protein
MAEINLTAVKDTSPKSMLSTWNSWGVSSIVRYGAYMYGMGGSALSVSAVKAWVDAAAPLGMKVGQKINLANYNLKPLLADWFDSASWDNVVYPAFIERLQAGNAAGVANYHIDGEEYGTNSGNGWYSGTGAYWQWFDTLQGVPAGVTYPHTRSDQAYLAYLRGARVGQLFAQYDPGKNVSVYYAKFPGDFNDLLQQRVNGAPPSDGGTMAQFFAGWLANTDAPQFTFVDYGGDKVPQNPDGFGAIIDQDRNSEVWLANRLGATTWAKVKPRLRWSAAAAISAIEDGVGPFKEVKSPSYVQSQLAAFAADTNFVQLYEQQLETFDYTPYISAIQNAAAIGSGTITQVPIQLTVRDEAGHTATATVNVDRASS